MAPNYDDHDNTERPRSRYGEGGGWEDPPEQFEGDRGAEPPPKQPRTFGGGRKSKGRAPRTYGGHQVPTAGNNSPAVPRSQPRQPKPAKVRAGNGADRPFTVTLAFVLTLLAGVSSLVWGAYLFAALKFIGQEGGDPLAGSMTNCWALITMRSVPGSWVSGSVMTAVCLSKKL